MTPDAAQFEILVASLDSEGWDHAAPGFLALWSAAPTDLKFGLMAGVGLLQTGRVSEGTALLSHLANRGHIIRTAQFNNAVPPKLREASHLADKAIRRGYTDIQRKALAGCEASGRIATALWPQTHDGEPPYPPSTQPPDRTRPRPYVFYAPDLPATEVFDTANWTKTLSQNTNEIRDEYLALMSRHQDAGAPYVPAQSPFGTEWQALKGQKSWNAVHLYKDSRAQAEAAHMPRTCAVLDDLPLTRQNGVPIEAFFSVLAPGVTIPPHYGLANCRVTVHLPLIVPSADPAICGIRVGEKTQGWTVGQPLIFDDSFDHSAWNLSDQSRVVLIFEAWRPDMSEGEIEAATASYAAREAYLRTISETVRALAGAEP